VLLADDHPVNRKVVELILGGAGVELTSVEDGKQACEAFAVGGYDLVFMDMQMPVMDGLTAVRLIRAREAVEGGRTPILMLTANALPEHVAAAELAGADGHLAKPITAQALFAAVESARARSEGMEAERTEAAA
jgi:CheY-like chemotaxis protein